MSETPHSPENNPNGPLNLHPNDAAAFKQALEDYKRASQQNNVEQGEAIALNLLALGADFSERYPAPDRHWHQQIGAHEQKLEWEQSIALRREHLTWIKDHDPNIFRWKNLAHLSRVLWMCGKRTEAAANDWETIRVARESGLPAALFSILPGTVRRALALGRLEAARQMTEEGMAASQQPVEQGWEKLNAQASLPLRLCRARLALKSGELFPAQQLLDEIWPEIQSSAESPILGGLRSRHAEHAELTGQLHLARSEITLAVEAFQRARHHCEAILEMPHIGEPHFLHYRIAQTFLLLAGALETTDRLAADKFRMQAQERFNSLGVPPGEPD